MVNRNHSFCKVRFGLYRCPKCGTYYDPTNGHKCSRTKFCAGFLAAIIALMFLFVCLPSNVNAQTEPPPDCELQCECEWIDDAWFCISHVEMPRIVYLPLIQR